MIFCKKMVYKKYTYKKGKRYGPYLYETKRVNGKIVTTYLGPAKKFDKSKLILPFVFVGVLLVLFFIFSGGLTGKVVLDIKDNYDPGDSIVGNFSFILGEEEFIPADSRVILSLVNVSNEMFLYDLVYLTSTTG